MTPATPIPANSVAVDVTDEMATRVDSMFVQVRDVLNMRIAAIDEKFGLTRNMSDVAYNALPLSSAQRVELAATIQLEFFVTAAVLGALAQSIARSMDPATKARLKQMISLYSSTMQSPADGGPPIHLIPIPGAPDGERQS